MKAVSVIVPIYNAEKWLHRCINSILSQSMHDMEILLINDGSTDSSASICDNYLSVDNRVRVIHQANLGISATREKAIHLATGEYISFIDADDWIEKEMILSMYLKAKEEEADVVMCDFYKEKPERIRLVRQDPTAKTKKELLMLFGEQLEGVLWNKMIRRTVFYTYSISFPEDLHYGEDKYVVMRLMECPLRIAYVAMPFYHFDCSINVNSLSRANSEIVFLNRIQFYQKMLTDFKGIVKSDISYIMVFYSYRMLPSGIVTQQSYAKAYQGKRSTILKAKGRLYKKICVYLASFKYGWPISLHLFNIIQSHS